MIVEPTHRVLPRPPRARRLAHTLATLAAAACVAASSTAAAQGKAKTPQARADALFREAIAMIERGTYAGACAKLDESQKLDPAVGTMLYLADCHEHEGRTATAWRWYVRAEEVSRTAGRDDRAKAAVAARKALEPKLTKLALRITAPVEGLVIKNNGESLEASALAAPFPVDPGPQALEASAPDKKTWSTSVDARGAGKTVEVAIPALDDAPAATPDPAPSPVAKQAAAPPPPAASSPSDARSGFPTQKALALTALGVAAVGVGVGVVFGVAAGSAYDESTALCPADGCPSAAARDEALASRDAAFGRAAASTIAFGVGGAALVAGAVLWFTTPRPTAAARVAPRGLRVAWSPALGPSMVGLSSKGVW